MSTRPTRYKTKPRTVDVERNWSFGPATPAWDDLWRRITREAILPAIEEHAPDAAASPVGPPSDSNP